MSRLRRGLSAAAQVALKEVAGAAFPGMKLKAAVTETGKYLNGERGESFIRVFEAILEYGDREILRALFDELLRDPVQLELLGARVRDIATRFEQQIEEITESIASAKRRSLR